MPQVQQRPPVYYAAPEETGLLGSWQLVVLCLSLALCCIGAIGRIVVSHASNEGRDSRSRSRRRRARELSFESEDEEDDLWG